RVGDRLYFRNSSYNNDYTIYRPLYTIDPATGNVVQVSGAQYVEYLTNVNGTLYFQGYSAASGYELYRINNTTGNAVLVDVVTGSGSSSPQNFTNVNGTVFFTATNSTNGTELWKLDTSGNPVLVKDIRTGSNSSSPSSLFAVGNALYFTADDGVNGRELWRSDGTAQGTVPLEIYIGSSTPNVSNLIDLGGVLYFTANNPTYGTELWRINSTTGNPEVVDVHSGASSSSPANLTNVNGTLYFTATTSATGTELYRINNTTGNPVLIDINSAGSGSSSPSNLTNVNGILYFTANNGTNGTELYRIDNATSNPALIDIVSGSSSSSPQNLLNANGVLYFTASNSANGRELWKLDPTTGNPVFLKDIYVGSNSSSPGNLTYSNGKLYFSADNYSQGIELWQTDGTPEGTTLVKDINATTLGSSPSNFIKIGNILYFTANDDVNGTELWRANPATGVVSLLDIYPGSNTSSVSNLTDVNGTLYFTANNGTNGTELYRIDNTTGNPVLIDINSGGSSSWPSNLTNVNGTLYFQAYTPTNGYELWKIDPATGTPSVINIVSGSGSSSPQNLLNANGVLYFTASNSANGRELWKVDPTTGNPVFLKDIYVGSGSSNPGNLTYSNGKLYFTADNGINGVELWSVNVDQITTIGVVQKTGDEDQVVPFTANDFASVFNSGSGLSLSKIKIINLPSNGLLKLSNNSVAVDQEIAVTDLGNLTFTPNTNYNGIAGFTWNGSDGTNYALNPSTVSLTINSINDVPTVASPIADTSIYSNRSSNFTISANAFQDVDLGDVLTYSATLADGSPLPSWLTFNERTFSGNPLIDSVGQYQIKVTATDQNNASATDTFVLSVVNSAPYSIGLSNNTIPENSANNTLIGTLISQDLNTNDTFTYTLVNNAGGRFTLDGDKIVVADTSLLDYETATQHTIRVKTTDSSGLSYEQNITIFLSNVNDALAGTLSFTSSTFSVNENGTPVANVTVQRTNGNEGTVSVNVLLSDGTAVFPNDYNSLAIPVVFGPGETSKTVIIPIVNDSDFEGNETVNLTLSSPTGGATLGTQTTATLTIVDNDLPTVSLAVSPASVTEDGTNNLVYTFTRTGNTASPLTVHFNVSGNATFNNDYSQSGADSFSGTSGSITFAAGSNTATLTIDPTADTIFEQDETVGLTLVSSANYNRGTTNTVTSTIINDDVNAGVLSFSSSQFSVNEDGTVVNAVTINRAGNNTGAVSVTLSLSSGTATAGSDYNNTPITVNFANGETSKTVNIPIINDSQLEADETVNLTLSNPQGGATLGTQTTAVLTIINDDLPQPGTISFNSANYSVNENANSSPIQILTVDSQTNIYPIGQPKVYSQVLTNGKKYRFEIAGTWSPDYRVNNWLVDARFVTRNNFVSVNDSDSTFGDFGLYSSILGNNNDDFLGNYQANHIYSLEYEGKGEPVDFYIYDINSGDNLGKYTIKIFELNTITLNRTGGSEGTVSVTLYTHHR
ncbi:MAG: hypothetical protein GPI98_20145, partial [Microcystis aeruginosa W13-13]|nr:hypothetical protein [Microcystis aeruginosa W13-13]